MADLSGYWKGVAITRTFQVVVHIFLQQQNENLTGKFESHDPQGRSSTGNLKGTHRGNDVAFSEDNGSYFRGVLVGDTKENQMIYGTMQAKDDKFPTGTLTLFASQGGIATLHYEP